MKVVTNSRYWSLTSTLMDPFRSLIAFHQSAYRLYRKHVTRSAWHPLNALAALGLAVRALGLLLGRGIQELGRTQKNET